jgi:hypothetical protein
MVENREGAAKKFVKRADATPEVEGVVQKAPESLDDTIKRWVETKPYTTTMIALLLGWLFGRAHRPF